MNVHVIDDVYSGLIESFNFPFPSFLITIFPQKELVTSIRRGWRTWTHIFYNICATNTFSEICNVKFLYLNLRPTIALKCTEQPVLLNARFYPISVLLLIGVDDVDKKNDFILSNILIVCMKNIQTVWRSNKSCDNHKSCITECKLSFESWKYSMIKWYLITLIKPACNAPLSGQGHQQAVLMVKIRFFDAKMFTGHIIKKFLLIKNLKNQLLTPPVLISTVQKQTCYFNHCLQRII